MCLDCLRELTEELTTVTTNCVLVVDDDENQVKTVADILDAQGVQCLVATTAKEAISLTKQNKPILALVDLRLENMNGIELIGIIKQISPFTKCIILTGFASQASAIEAVNLGVVGYFEKPGAIKKVLKLIHKVMH